MIQCFAALSAKNDYFCGTKFYKYSTKAKIMVTFKAEVYAHQRKKDGTYNIKIRVTHHQKKRYLSTSWFVTKEDLTRSMKIKNQKYIDLTSDLIKVYRSRCEIPSERLDEMDIDQVVDLIQSKKQEAWDLDIIQFADQFIKELRNTGHEGNARSYEIALASLKNFLDRDSLSVKEITVGFLRDWIAWIKKGKNITTGFAPHNYVSRLRAIFNQAKKIYNDEDAGIIRIPNSPFQHIDFPKQPVPEKRAITLEQLQKIASLQDRSQYQVGTNRFNFSRDLFLLSFSLIGMNAADLYEVEAGSLVDGRVTYNRRKTRNRRADQAEISVKVEPEAAELIQRYRDPSGVKLFDFYHRYGTVGSFEANLNKGLKKVGTAIGVEGLEFYAARHTWATLAVNQAGVDKYTVHQALNHVDDSMRNTDMYIKKSYDGNDLANRKVLDLSGIGVLLKQKPDVSGKQ